MTSDLFARLAVGVRPAMVVAGTLAVVGLAGCANPPPPAIPASGITSSNGGGMRATGAVPDITLGPNGNSSAGPSARNPRVPTY